MEVPGIEIQTESGVSLRYHDPIDLSNACRAFYQTRLETTRRMRERWGEGGEMEDWEECGGGSGSSSNSSSNSSSTSSGDGVRKKCSLDIAINILRREMATLMEQDLTLMQQLLTLNEEIEQLKWRRRHVWSRASSCSSDMLQSAASLGTVNEHPALTFSTPSSLSLQLDGTCTRISLYNDDDPNGTFNRSHPSRDRCYSNSIYNNDNNNSNSVGRRKGFGTWSSGRAAYTDKGSLSVDYTSPSIVNSSSNSNSSTTTSNAIYSSSSTTTTTTIINNDNKSKYSKNSEHLGVDCDSGNNSPVDTQDSHNNSSNVRNNACGGGRVTNDARNSSTNSSTATVCMGGASTSTSQTEGTRSEVTNCPGMSFSGKDSPSREQGPEPYSARHKKVLKSSDMDSKSQDSGIHDCSGTG